MVKIAITEPVFLTKNLLGSVRGEIACILVMIAPLALFAMVLRITPRFPAVMEYVGPANQAPAE